MDPGSLLAAWIALSIVSLASTALVAWMWTRQERATAAGWATGPARARAPCLHANRGLDHDDWSDDDE